ncbi:hypothetical protein, partial [Mycobacteroides abscessus]
PAVESSQALADDIGLILIDDIDTVVNGATREVLRQHLCARTTHSGAPAAFVITCQDPALIEDLLPSDRAAVRTHQLSGLAMEVTQ